MISVDEAIVQILESTQSLTAVEVLISNAMGCILQEDVLAPHAIPPFPASIMDGYAVQASSGEGVLEVIGQVTAGLDPGLEVGPGQAVYITTGAKLPKGADAVIKVEDTKSPDLSDGTIPGGERTKGFVPAEETAVQICKGVVAGRNVRKVGSDVAEGQVVMQKGDILTSTDVGLLAALGVAKVLVFSKPKVGVISSGDELVDPMAAGAALDGGARIFDANRYTLLALLTQLGAEPVDLGIVRDQGNALEEALLSAANTCDAVITTGGVSMGDSDLIKPLLQKIGKVHFGRIKMKPGKPTTFATVPRGDSGKEVLFFALPGNPVSCAVTTRLLVQPALRKLSGADPAQCMLPQVSVKLGQTLKLDPERPEYHRASVTWDSVGCCLVARSTGSQISSRLLSMRGANALLCLPQAQGVMEAGTYATALLIDSIPAPDPKFCFHYKAATLGLALGEEDAPEGSSGGGGSPSSSSSSQYVSLDRMAKKAKVLIDPSQGGAPKEGEEGEGHHQGTAASDGLGECECCRAAPVVPPSTTTTTTAPSPPVAPGRELGPHETGPRARPVVRACVLTVSDRCAAGSAEDRGGPKVVDLLRQEANPFELDLVETAVVPDEIEKIQTAVMRWTDQGKVDLVITTGGTGFGLRDRTPEALRPILHREAPGLVFALLQEGTKNTPLAVLSRPVAGTREKSLIVTLPGSTKAVKENLVALIPLLPRIVNLLNDNAC